MSPNDMDAFLWVDQRVFLSLVRSGVTAPLAKARAEIATARSFAIEPLNWAKRDIGIFVENKRIFENKRNDVERRLRAAQERSREAESVLIRSKDFDPLKIASMYWFESDRKKNPNNPYAIAIEKERKIEDERRELYHQFNKETPEEKAAGALVMLLAPLMMGAAEGELTGEAEAALGSLSEAEAALAVAESGEALTSIMKARAILIPAEEGEALMAVNEARTALAAGEIDMAASAVEDARGALSTQLQVNPAAPLALAAINEAEVKLDAAEKADADLGVSERAKIDLFYQSSLHQDEVKQFLAADSKVARDYRTQYSALVAKGKIIPKKGGDEVMREGCQDHQAPVLRR
jgi:hypothetical protein